MKMNMISIECIKEKKEKKTIQLKILEKYLKRKMSILFKLKMNSTHDQLDNLWIILNYN